MNIDDLIKKNEDSKRNVNISTAPVGNTTGASTGLRYSLAESIFKSNPKINDVFEPNSMYRKLGITQNRIDTNLDKIAAEKQSILAKGFNSVLQTVVGEIGLGTVRGASDLIGGSYDLVGMLFKKAIGEPINSSEKYHNSFSEYIESLREGLEEATPIAYDTSKAIDSGALTEGGWWFKNLPSIASSITLMVPAYGVTKGLGALSKLTKLNKAQRKLTAGIGKFGRNLSQSENAIAREAGEIVSPFGTTSALTKTNEFVNYASMGILQRTMENFQESREEYQNVYNSARETLQKMDDNQYAEFLENNPNYKGMNQDLIAKDIATKAADETFKDDWVNVTFDVLEMYGLGSAWKGLKSVTASKSLKNYNKRAAQLFGKKESANSEELSKTVKSQKTIKLEKELEKATKDGDKEKIESLTKAIAKSTKQDKLKNIGSTVVDALGGTRKLVLTQLNEGVEEAVNYAAQQEGDYLASQILGTEESKNFDQRVNMYLHSPQLWESAFWGLAGGIVFGGVAPHIQRAFDKSAIVRNEQRKAEIESRQVTISQFIEDIEKIKKGQNIYAVLPEDKVFAQDDEAGKQAAINKRKRQLAYDLSLTAANTGNLDLLKEYLRDENVKKGLIEMGIATEDDVNKVTNELLESVDAAQKSYDFHFNHLYNLTSQLPDFAENEVNMNIIQMIATENAKRDFTYGLYNKDNEALLAHINKESIDPTTGKRLDDLAEQNKYESLMRSQIVGTQLAYYKALLKQLEKQNTIEALAKIPTIKNTIKTLENIQDVNKDYVSYLGLQGNIDEFGNYTFAPNVESNKFKVELTAKAAEAGDQHIIDSFTEYEREGFASNETGLLNELQKNHPQIYNATKSKVVNEMMGQIELGNRIDTLNDLKESTDMMTAHLNSAVENAGREAYKTITDLTFKYGGNVISNAIASNVKGLNVEFARATSNMEDEDVEELIKAIDALKLTTNGTSQGIYNSIVEHLETINTIVSRTANPTVNPQPAPQPTKKYDNIKIIPSSGVISVDSKDNSAINLPVVQNPDGTYTLNSTDSITFTDRFYETDDGSNVDGSKKYNIIEHPILEIDDKGNITITKKGKLQAILPTGGVNPTSTTATASTSQSNPIPASPTTPGISSTPNPAPSPAPKTGTGEDNINVDDEDPRLKQQNLVRDRILQIIREKLKSGSINATEDEFRRELKEKVIETLKANGIAESDIDEGIIDNNINTYFAALARKNVTFAQAASIIENTAAMFTIPFNNIYGLANNKTFRENIKKYFETILDNYAEIVGIEKIDGKYYINSIDLTLCIKDICQDEELADKIYDIFKWYSNSDNSILVFTDTLAANKQEFINSLELKDENSKVNGVRVDTQSYLNELKFDPNTGLYTYGVLTFTPAEYNEAINAVNEGAELTYINYTGTQRLSLCVKINSGKEIPIGTLSTPKIKNDTGLNYLTMAMGNIITDVAFDPVMNKVQSVLSNYIKKLIHGKEFKGDKVTATKEDIKAFIDIITEWNTIPNYQIIKDTDTADSKKAKEETNKHISERKAKLIEAYLNNNVYAILKEVGVIVEQDDLIDFTGKDIDADTYREHIAHGLSYLSSLWTFTNRRLFGLDDSTKDELRESSVDNWFDRLYDNYNVSKALADNVVTQEYKVTVHGKTSTSHIELPYDATKKRNGYELPSTCFAGGYKSDTHKMAVVWPEYGGMIISGTEIRSNTGMRKGNTFVTFPRPDGELAYVSTCSNSFSDDALGKNAKQIVDIFKNNINYTLEQMSKNNTGVVYALYNFLASVANVGNPASLIQGIYGAIRNTTGFVLKVDSRNVIPIKNEKNEEITNFNQIRFKGNQIIFQQYSKGGTTEQLVLDLSDNNNLQRAKEYFNNYVNSLNFSQSKDYLLGDNEDFNVPNKAGQHTIDSEGNKKFTITLYDMKSNETKEFTFDSYSDFLLKENCVSCATKVVDGSNFEQPDAEHSRKNFKLFIDIEAKTPTKETNTSSNPPVEGIEGKVGVDFANDIRNKIESTRVRNKGNVIFSSVFPASKLRMLKSLKVYDLLPKNVIFVEDMNEGSVSDNPRDMKGPIARHIDANEKTGTPSRIEVGNRFLAMMAIPTLRKEAVRKLIHEQLHEILSRDENRKHIDKLQEVFDDFKKSITESGEIDKYKNYLYEDYTDNQLRLEEFLVESLTSKELFDKLNSIEAKGYKINEKSKNKSLFQKIADILRKVFNWVKKDDTLYAKEWNIFNDMFNDNEVKDERINEKEEENTNVEEESKTPTAFNPFGNNYTSPTNITSNEDEDVDDESEYSNFMEGEITPNPVNLDSDTQTIVRVPSSISEFTDSLPIDKRANFAQNVANGGISTSCR